MPESRSPVILHATACSPVDEVPRMHAVALAAAAHGHLVTVHTTDVRQADIELPEPMPLLRRWAQARGVATEELGSLEHEGMVREGADDPTAQLVELVQDLEPDLVVAGTRARTGIELAFMGSTALALLEGASVPVLLLPAEHPGFVDERTGELRLRKVVVAAGDKQSAQAALDAAIRIAELCGPHVGEFLLVRVGNEDDVPALKVSGAMGWGRRWVFVEGNVVDGLVDLAEHEHAELIVMASRGHDSVLDSLLGSHTERVLRRSPCAMLAVPLG